MEEGRPVGDPGWLSDDVGPQKTPSRRSLLALDGVNVFLADVRDGLGPYVGIFLRDVRHWDPARVGFVLMASQVVSVLVQTPIGALIDRTRHKRLAVAVAAIGVAIGCVLIYFADSFPMVVALKAGVGAAGAVFPPAIAALSLGLVGRAAMPRRTGRNEAFNHAGNVAVALLAGGAALAFGYEALFVLVAVMASASAGAVLLIRERDIDHDLARGADDGPGHPHEVASAWRVLEDRRIVIFAASCVLFHLANAAMLPLAGQKASDGLKDGAPMLMSACIVAAQVVMIPVALMASRLAATWGRKPVFLVGFVALPIRGLLYCLSVNPYYVVGVQLLDGIGAGIFGVVSVLVIADLTRGTGRFNLTQGAVATATGLGAGLSNGIAGLIVAKWGFDAGFATLAAVAAVGAAFFAVMMPETGRGDGDGASPVPATSAEAWLREEGEGPNPPSGRGDVSAVLSPSPSVGNGEAASGSGGERRPFFREIP